MFKKGLFLVVILFIVSGSSFGFSFKKLKLKQNGLLVKYKADSNVKPVSIVKEKSFFKVYLNEKKKENVVITAQQFINRILGTVVFGSKPITVEKDEKGVFLKVPLFTKGYKYEAIINGAHFWFYIKK